MEVVEEPEPVPPELRPAEDREPTPRPEPEAAPPEPAPRRAPRAPGRREARPAPRKAREKVRPTAPEPGAPRVLVVEDEADNRELLVLLLRRRGIEVHAAANGTEGVRLMREISPDVGLIDIGLPDLDGYEVGRRARSLLGEKILLVALTGYGHPQARRRTKEAGFDVHLTKPVDMKRLVAMIKERAGGEQPAAPPP